MAKKKKALERARSSPKGWRYKKLRSLLVRYGFEIRPGKGSHQVATFPGTDIRVTIVSHSGEVSREYVKDAVEAIDEVIARYGDQS